MFDRALLFDWGGTLMETMPVYQGEERGWSTVPPVEGAVEAVKAASKSWRVALATNASESGDEAIFAAFEPLSIRECFSAVYSFGKAGRPKPWVEFWRYALNDLQLPAERVVMIGDSYMDDIWGATEVGMNGIWFNRRSSERKEKKRVRTIHSYAELNDALASLGF
ncbi:HAD family hydrolase [Halodesulfovibrio marinisediminis]|uniref:Putative hydrolase of the HAD superfamily n=1 Tax=Halodesulfovibrio marinisediminis DSM 17456 TaxID=1121457 RepID=A0A1N6DFH1_9BACT|nr:HAD family hydrolase [Halodesulfovibrio marinisediminis]SIN69551.1 putative hydrolase of the HAD superfamily [Halodesulfovibrio marinisediminis DSM 17456]